MIERTCEECKDVFLVYPSSKKKYCSIKCAGKARSKWQTGCGNASWTGGSKSKEEVAEYNREYRKKRRAKCISCLRLCYGERCKSCRTALGKKKIKLICKECNKKFIVFMQNKKQKYCSKKCHDISQTKKVKIVCKICDKMKLVPPSLGIQKYCSHKCKGLAKTGMGNPNWKDGATNLNHKIRDLRENKMWRISIFERDKYTCVICDKIGGNLEAHHIDSFNDILSNNNITSVEEARLCEGLWDTNNGVTVCTDCHTDIDENRFGNKRII